MALKTKRGSIPSINISKDFLRDLGEILESEFNSRKNIATIEAEKIILKDSIEIEARTYYESIEEKEQAKKENAERVRRQMQPHINLNYSIDAKIEDLTFGSMQEVVDTKFFPKNIESIAFRVTHYRADQYVDISINMSQRWYGATGSYNLSSSSEEGLLKIESHLKALFDSNLTVYKALLYPTASSVYLMPRILSFLVSVTVMYLGYVKFGEVALGGWLFIFWLVYMYSMELIKFAFPYYKFEIGYSNQYRSYLQKILIAIIVTVIVTTTYDFVKSLF